MVIQDGIIEITTNMKRNVAQHFLKKKSPVKCIFTERYSLGS